VKDKDCLKRIGQLVQQVDVWKSVKEIYSLEKRRLRRDKILTGKNLSRHHRLFLHHACLKWWSRILHGRLGSCAWVLILELTQMQQESAAVEGPPDMGPSLQLSIRGFWWIFLHNFALWHAFQEQIAPKWLAIDQDNLRMKFSACNVDFSSPSPDALDSSRPAHVGVNERYPCKSGYLYSVGLSSV